MKKAKNILFRMKLKGNGIVNFDSVDQKWVYNDTNLKSGMFTQFKNTSYAKKKFYKNSDGDLSYKISISSDCIRHDVFKDDVLFQSPNIINSEVLLHSFIASPASLLRGYLLTSSETLKRKGALTITDAEQTCGAVSYIETFSRSGAKNTDTEKDGSDNTFYKKEVVGDIEYKSMGSIDLMQLQFVSCDQIFDRYAFNPDMFSFYKQFLKTKLPTFDSELGYYQINNSIVELPEYGFKMSDTNIEILVREMFERLLKFSIKRKGSYVETSELEYKIVYDVIDDTFDDADGWVSIKNRNDLASISFNTEEFYLEQDSVMAKEKRDLIVANYEMAKKLSKDKKATEKQTKKTVKTVKTEITNDGESNE